MIFYCIFILRHLILLCVICLLDFILLLDFSFSVSTGAICFLTSAKYTCFKLLNFNNNIIYNWQCQKILIVIIYLIIHEYSEFGERCVFFTAQRVSSWGSDSMPSSSRRSSSFGRGANTGADGNAHCNGILGACEASQATRVWHCRSRNTTSYRDLST